MVRIVIAVFLLAGLLPGLLVGLPARAEVPRNDYGVAVIIGNKTYPGRTPDAEYAHNDAVAMKKFVVDRLGYRPGNIIDLRDATKGQMEAVFGTKETHKGKLFNWLRSGKSDVIVFYSGHGVPGLQDKRGYLLPVDGDPNLAEITGFPVDRLYANLAKLPARSVTVFLDACFSGETPKGMLIRAASGLTVTPRAPETARSLTVITAAQGDQFASWDEDAKHGLFTRHLLLALGGRADGSAYGDGDGNVSLTEVKKYLDDEMTYQARRRYGRAQMVSVEGIGTVVLASFTPSRRPAEILSFEEFRPLPSVQVAELDASYVALKTANVRSEPTTASAKLGGIARDSGVTVTGTVAGGKWLRIERPGGQVGYIFASLLAPVDSGEIAAWGKVKDAKAAGAVTAFLRSYPGGHFAARAKQLEAALTLQVAAVIPPEVTAPRPVKPVVGVYPGRRPGDSFKDCADCPEMVVVPSGAFRMGDLQGGGDSDEKPVHDVRIGYSFAVGKFEVTFTEWDACVSAGGCGGYRPADQGWGRGWRPVMKVSWDDAQAYVSWLSAKTGQSYRLLSEAEWEYVARAGTGTKYSWGNQFDSAKANNNGSTTRPVGSYEPNGFGLYDVHGNVLEWVEDCWHDDYNGAPTDGSAWTSGSDCSRRVLRGGAWYYNPGALGAAYRSWLGTGDRDDDRVGFRLARTLSP